MRGQDMQEIQITKLSQYLDAIEQLKDYYSCSGPHGPFLYRGLSKDSYKLLPGLFRRKLRDRDEKKILHSFIQESSSILHLPTDELLRWVEYAQHYGVPTRFLDWTSNPLVALYFSCKSSVESNGRVWLLHKANYTSELIALESCDKDEPIKTLIEEMLNGQDSFTYPIQYTPYYVDPRMSAQNSYFMVWGSKREPLEEMFSDDKYYMTLRNKDGELYEYLINRPKQFLFCFLIPAKDKEPLLQELDNVGINEKTLFPGLDGIGRYIAHIYRTEK